VLFFIKILNNICYYFMIDYCFLFVDFARFSQMTRKNTHPQASHFGLKPTRPYCGMRFSPTPDMAK
jgi:hypothetical protein